MFSQSNFIEKWNQEILLMYSQKISKCAGEGNFIFDISMYMFSIRSCCTFTGARLCSRYFCTSSKIVKHNSGRLCANMLYVGAQLEVHPRPVNFASSMQVWKASTLSLAELIAWEFTQSTNAVSQALNQICLNLFTYQKIQRQIRISETVEEQKILCCVAWIIDRI